MIDGRGRELGADADDADGAGAAREAGAGSGGAGRRPVSDAYFALDRRWGFTDCNDRAARLLGQSREDLLGRVIWDEFPETRETDFPEECHRAVEAGEPRRFSVYHRPLDATLAVRVYPTDDGLAATMRRSGEPPGGPGLAGEGDPAAGALRRIRERLVAVADVPMFALDGGGRFLDANGALCSLVGRDREALVGEHVSTLIESATDEVALRSVLARGESTGHVEVTVETAGGDRRRCAADVAPIPDGVGVEGMVCTLRDVTPRRQREQRLAVLDRVLRHNMRNDLNVALVSAEAIENRTDDPVVAERAERVAETARGLIGLSDDVRRFSDALDPEIGEARAHDAADRVRGIVERAREDHPGADVRLVLHDEPVVRAHESALLAVEELVENAVVHTADPLVRVSVAATGDPGDGAVEIEVADRGSGLPDAERSVLTGGDESPLEHASGLGLWLVNWGITKSGGDLEFSENDPWGSVVTARLPRGDPGAADEVVGR